MSLLFVIFYAGFQASVLSQLPCDFPNVEITAELSTGIWAEEIAWSIFNDSDELIAGPFSGFEDNTTYTQTLCLGFGCYYALLEDSYGDGWQGGSIVFFSSENITGSVTGSSEILDISTDPSCGILQCEAGTGDRYYATISADLYGEELAWEVWDSEGTIAAGPFGNFGEYVTGEVSSEAFCLIPECYTVVMYDSYGDGWNGNTFVIADDNGFEYLNATISTGSTGTASACLPSGICMTMTCGGGSYTSEVGWSLTDDASATVILTGGAPYSDTLCTPYTGCADVLASNYDATALVDDGSCLYATTFNVDMNCEPAGSFGYVHLESPLFGWCGGCVPMTDADGDGVWTVTVDLAPGSFEYKYAVDGFAGQENLVDDMVAGASCAPVTDYWSYANRLVTVAA